MRRFWLLLLLVCASTGLRAQTFNLQTGREPVASLDGLWRFHTGDNPAWASPNFDDSHWPLIRSDTPWTAQGYANYSGYAWYRFKLQVPDGSKPPGLLPAIIYTGYQVYADGSLVGSAGSTSPRRAPFFAVRPQIFRLPTGSPGPRTIQIALRVWEYPPIASWVGGGPLHPGNAAGDPDLLTHRLLQNLAADSIVNVNDYAYCLLAAFIGLTVFVLFLSRPEDREYLWFAVLLLVGAADAALLIRGFSGIPFLFYRLLDEIANGFSLIAALAFFSIVLGVRRSLLWWAACIAAAVSPLAVAPYYFQWTPIGVAYAIQLFCLLPAYFWIILALAMRAIRKDAAARLLFAPAALFCGWGIADATVRITWELGWQRRLLSINRPLLLHPFPLHPSDIVNYIFILALLIFLVRRFSLARQEETRLSNEMEAARGIQSLLIPETAPATPGFSVETVYIPASEVGGDFFQVLSSEDGSLLIVAGDVSGKGLKAAMTVSAIVGALRNERERQPARVLSNLNRVLHGQITGFATCAAALIDPEGKVTLANAGNPAPYRNGEELPVDSGLPLGIVAEGAYSETTYHLEPGDRLTFVSDGVVEATNEKRELFGFDRTQAISNQSATAIATAAQQFGQQDDISVLAITRAPALKAALA